MHARAALVETTERAVGAVEAERRFAANKIQEGFVVILPQATLAVGDSGHAQEAQEPAVKRGRCFPIFHDQDQVRHASYADTAFGASRCGGHLVACATKQAFSIVVGAPMLWAELESERTNEAV